MTENPYEIPAQIGELTEKSIEKARKAFESFIEAAQKAAAQAEDTASALQSSAKEASAKALSFTEAHVRAAFDHAQKLIHSKDPQEATRRIEREPKPHGSTYSPGDMSGKRLLNSAFSIFALSSEMAKCK